MRKKTKKKISWHTAYKVANGLRNCGVENARLLSEVTGTDPLVWIDPAKAQIRKQFLSVILRSGIVGERKRKVTK